LLVKPRFIDDGGYLIVVETNGSLAEQNAVHAAQQQILSTLDFPAASDVIRPGERIAPGARHS